MRESRLPVPAATAGRVCRSRTRRASRHRNVTAEGGGPVGTVILLPVGLAAKRWCLLWHRMSDIPVSIRLVAHRTGKSPRPGI